MPKLCECARSVAASRQYNQFEINFTHARQWWITWMCAMRAVWLRKHKFIITYVVRVAYVCVCNIIDDCLLPQQRLVEQFPFLICCWRFPSGYSHHYQLIDEIIECVSLALLLHQHISLSKYSAISFRHFSEPFFSAIAGVRLEEYAYYSLHIWHTWKSVLCASRMGANIGREGAGNVAMLPFYVMRINCLDIFAKPTTSVAIISIIRTYTSSKHHHHNVITLIGTVCCM